MGRKDAPARAYNQGMGETVYVVWGGIRDYEKLVAVRSDETSANDLAARLSEQGCGRYWAVPLDVDSPVDEAAVIAAE